MRSKAPKPSLLWALVAPLFWLGATVAPFLLAGVVAYVALEDQIVRQQFEGKRWALPARVFAAPIELFVGAPYEASGFEWLLGQLKYRRDPQLLTQGSFIRLGDELVFRTRDFQFPDRNEPSRAIRLQFADGQVLLMEDMETGQPIDLWSLEPPQIGSFYPARREDRVLIRLDQAPKPLLKALFASEDHSFYQHHGVSPKGILRALYVNLKAGGIVQGGSTLTQQLVKNFYLSAERTWWRKINEIVMAMILDARYSKEEILEAYLNEIYLGQDGSRAIHGFGLASQYYFGRAIEELELHHTALLVALVRGPSYYDPYTAPERVLKRRNLILAEMRDQGFIDAPTAAKAEERALDVVRDPHQPVSRYPAFMDLLKRQLEREYRPADLTSEGLRIFTTLDVSVQQRLQAVIDNELPALEKKPKADPLEVAALWTRRGTGEIAALVGGRKADQVGFNRALDATRQIGSLFKPVVYLAALEDPSRYTLTSLLSDAPIQVKVPGSLWIPKNYDGKTHGTLPLFSALAHSYNHATVRLGMDIGVHQSAEMLHRLGVRRSVDEVPALLLGATALTPMEVAQMYQTLASDGFLTPLRAIQSVISAEGRVLQRYGIEVRQTVEAGPVSLLNAALQQVFRIGTGRPASKWMPDTLSPAGKTGTTNELRDSWFAGFTGDYLGVVWIGRDNNEPAGLTGAEGALRLWARTMAQVSRQPLDLEFPQEVRLQWVDSGRGARSGPGCPAAIQLPFLAGSAPQDGSGCGTAVDAGD